MVRTARQFDVDRGAAAAVDRIVSPDATAVQLDGDARNVQANPGAFEAVFDRRVGTIKATEDQGTLVGWNADAVIGNGEVDQIALLMVTINTDADPDRATIR